MTRTLTAADLAAAAAALGCDLPAVKAVLAVESQGRGFDPDSGRPLILYEPHWFSRLTQRRYDQRYPELSYPRWGTRPYPRRQAERWAQLEAASRLDRAAAVAATSWGLFQIMGFNHSLCGFADVETFVAAMERDEAAQLAAFAAFVLAKGLDRALRAHDWWLFARVYNGPGQVAHYAAKLESAWRAAGGR